jgi:hypothetical protein
MKNEPSFVSVNLEQVILLLIVLACYATSFAFSIPAAARTVFICIGCPLAIGVGKMWYRHRKSRSTGRSPIIK